MAPFAVAATINEGYEDTEYVQSTFIMYHLGLKLRSFPLMNANMPCDDQTRTNDENNPGYYYESPIGHEAFVDSSDIQYIKNTISQYINNKYYDDKILNYIKNYNISMHRRKEFFFSVKSNGIEFKFSGWYGKFVHIIVDADFSSPEDFVKNTEKYLKLSKLNKDKVSCFYNDKTLSDGRHELFYTYDDELGSNLKLIGYSIKDPEDSVDKIKKTVIDLTIYTEGQTDETTK